MEIRAKITSLQLQELQLVPGHSNSQKWLKCLYYYRITGSHLIPTAAPGPKDEYLAISLDDREYAWVQDQCAQTGFNLSEFVRFMIAYAIPITCLFPEITRGKFVGLVEEGYCFYSHDLRVEEVDWKAAQIENPMTLPMHKDNVWLYYENHTLTYSNFNLGGALPITRFTIEPEAS